MSDRKRIFLIIAAIVVVCGGIVGAAALNMDKILRRVSPELYLSYMAVNTIHEIENERAMIADAMPDRIKLSDSYSMTVKLDSEKQKLDLTEDYNADTPSAVFSGDYNGTELEGYINNTETGLCLPNLLDVYFTFSTKDFGDEFVDGGGEKLLPIGIPRGLDLTLPQKRKNEEVLGEAKAVSLAKTLIQDAEIRHDSGDQYFLILKSEYAKTAAKDFVSAVLSSEKYKDVVDRIERFNDGEDLEAKLTDAIDRAELGETLTVGYTQQKNYISRIQADVPCGDTTLAILFEGRGVRLLEDYTVSVISKSGDAKVGLELNGGGNRMFADEQKTDQKEWKLLFGDGEIASMRSDFSLDKNNTRFSGNISVNTQLFGTASFSAAIQGVPMDGHDMKNGWMADITDIKVGDSLWGSASVQIKPSEQLQPSDRKKYRFADLKLNDLKSLLDLMKP